ncbi:hypothetical protein CapIbe_005710 [Capra ibex]
MLPARLACGLLCGFLRIRSRNRPSKTSFGSRSGGGRERSDSRSGYGRRGGSRCSRTVCQYCLVLVHHWRSLRLQRSWRYRGDVYLVGATDAGKSTLFNTLLESDYRIAKGAEAIDRATISPWPR